MDGMNNFDQNQQPVPPQPNMYVQPEMEAPITMGDWILTLILTCIPCVNIIMLFVWAFGSSTPKSKSNWAKAELIIVAIAVVISIILSAVMGTSMAALYG